MAGHKMCSMACLALACAAESSAGREGDGAGEWKSETYFALSYHVGLAGDLVVELPGDTRVIFATGYWRDARG